MPYFLLESPRSQQSSGPQRKYEDSLWRLFRKSRGLSDAHIPAPGGPEEDLILLSSVLFTNLYPTFLIPCSPDHFLIVGDTLSIGSWTAFLACVPLILVANIRKSPSSSWTKCHCGELDVQAFGLTSNQSFCQNIISSSFRVVVTLRCIAQRFPQGTVYRPARRQLLTPRVSASAAGSFVT